MAILEGESLLNDAAGLVSFQIALAAIITGTIQELKETHLINMDTNQQVAYAMVIRKLQEKQIWYAKNSKFLIKEFKRIYKVIDTAQTDKIKNLVSIYDNNKILADILHLSKLRIAKLISYSIVKQIFIQIRISAT